MAPVAKVVLVAVAAGIAGVMAGVYFRPDASTPLVRTELGQRMLQAVLTARAPAVPAGVAVAVRGRPIPTLRLRDLDANLVELPRDLAGRRVLINVWASWCAPCIREMPELQRFSRQQAVNGVQVVGIALDDADSVRRFLQRTPVGYRILLDAPGPADAGVRLGNPMGVLPYSVLVSGDGSLLKRRVGPFAPGEIDRWARD